jgi:hypothetical protein
VNERAKEEMGFTDSENERIDYNSDQEVTG